MFEIGDNAPDFELLNSKEEPVKLSDHRGTRIILFFYPKAGTSGCTTQACGFRDNFPVIEAGNATVIGISPDMPAALAKWIESESLPYALLSDPDHAVADLYGVWGEKSMYGNKYMGIIRSHFVIDAEGKFEDVQFKVSPKNSIARALSTVG
ncbi:MAG TPA: thioredoxin-dependent thiol peroxidase [candidate division Zixibacteria bacterium]|nr:thioredoxin-dependent thiol peroxidase [candidate division Zixibacteria bacterium]